LRESIVFSIGSNYAGNNDLKYEVYTSEIYGRGLHYHGVLLLLRM